MPGISPLGLQNLQSRASQGDPGAIEQLQMLGYDQQGNPLPQQGPPGGGGMAPPFPGVPGAGGMPPPGGMPGPGGMPPQQAGGGAIPGRLQQMIGALRGQGG